MTRSTTRLAVGTTIGAFALVTAVSPALAAKPTKRPTSITLKAAHTSVAPKHKDALTGTLKTGHTPLAGRSVNLMKRAPGKAWSLVTTKTTDSKGQVTLTVTPGAHKGQKTQYEPVFTGDSTDKGSHSAVITLNVS